MAEFIYRSDTHPGEYIVASVFESREAFQRNTNDPEEDRWYRRWSEYLIAEPEWGDGKVVYRVIYATKCGPSGSTSLDPGWGAEQGGGS